MERLRSPWLLGLALVAALGLWVVTIGPWGPWHWRQVTAVRIVLHGRPGIYHTRISPWATLRGGHLRLRIVAAPVPSSHADALPSDFFGDAEWWVTNTPSREPGALRHRVDGGAEALLGADPARVVDVTPAEGRVVYGASRLGLKVGTSRRAEVTATLSETTDAVQGFPVVGIIVFAWLVAFAAQTIWVAGRRAARAEAPRSEHHEA